MTIFLLSIVTYCIGSVLFAVLLANHLALGDLRQQGSGNVGATNIARLTNKKIGFLVALLDILKGMIPIYMSQYFLNISSTNDNNSLLLMFIGSLAILGHLFPVWYSFKGGKGIATYIGVHLAINFDLGISLVCVWLITFLLFKISSLSSLCMVILGCYIHTSSMILCSLNIVLCFTCMILFYIIWLAKAKRPYIFMICMISISIFNRIMQCDYMELVYMALPTCVDYLIIYKHKDNIKRLMNFTEKKIK